MNNDSKQMGEIKLDNNNQNRVLNDTQIKENQIGESNNNLKEEESKNKSKDSIKNNKNEFLDETSIKKDYPKKIIDSKEDTEKSKNIENKSDEELKDNPKISDSLEENLETMFSQIDEVKEELEKNISWAEESGTLMGGLSSSGYFKGIDTVKSNLKKIINTLINKINSFSEDDMLIISFIENNLLIALNEGKEKFDIEQKKLKHNTLLELNKLQNKYLISDEKTGKLLDKLRDNFAKTNLKNIGEYTDNIESISLLLEKNLKDYF